MINLCNPFSDIYSTQRITESDPLSLGDNNGSGGTDSLHNNNIITNNLSLSNSLNTNSNTITSNTHRHRIDSIPSTTPSSSSLSAVSNNHHTPLTTLTQSLDTLTDLKLRQTSEYQIMTFFLYFIGFHFVCH